MKKLFYHEPTPSAVEINGPLIATAIERIEAENKTSRLVSLMSIIAIGSAMGVKEGFSSEKDILYFAVPTVVNGLIQIHTERTNRRHIKDLKKIGPKIQAEISILRQTYDKEIDNATKILQDGNMIQIPRQDT